ncbi:MAG: DUF3305 domain-containing protein [Chromatiaceae bacterium]|nr:DUF3305 domain-containing protein [Chromatiaceae bacterium]MCP5315785.1 DUF3305 domain-containing protein [Chromatiaceae bacterium]
MTENADTAGEARGRFPVAVVLQRTPATSPWIEHVWDATGIAVNGQYPDREPQLVRDDGKTAVYLVGGLQVSLHADECESYYYNLVSETPRAYVVAHATDDNDRPQPFCVSMSFDEAHAYLEGDDRIFAVEVPPELYRWTEQFVIANYFPQKKLKRKLRDWSADTTGESSA